MPRGIISKNASYKYFYNVNNPYDFGVSTFISLGIITVDSKHNLNFDLIMNLLVSSPH